jgi:hypothetical protein
MILARDRYSFLPEKNSQKIAKTIVFLEMDKMTQGFAPIAHIWLYT